MTSNQEITKIVNKFEMIYISNILEDLALGGRREDGHNFVVSYCITA